MNTEQELLDVLQEAIDLLAERKYGNPARSPGHNARLLLQDILAARRSIDEQVEVVGWRARRWGSSKWELFAYDPRSLKQFSFFEPLYRAPPAVAAGGVTEAELVALAGKTYDDVLSGKLPHINPFQAVVEAITAALAVGDEGIREVLRDALRFISNIDNAHPVVRKLRAALKDTTHAE